MSVPSAGMMAMWRNNIEDIKSLLESRHRNAFLIFNLSGEAKYDYEVFNNQVWSYNNNNNNNNSNKHPITVERQNRSSTSPSRTTTRRHSRCSSRS